MLATALTFSLIGLEAHPVRVEVDSGRGPANFQLVGLAEPCVRESRVRVRAALQQIGIDLAEYVITVNLAPAELKKNSGAFDVAIAMATLGALGRIRPTKLSETALFGELSLTGTVQPIKGILAALRGARNQGLTHAIVPVGNEREAASMNGMQLSTATCLQDIVAYFNENKTSPPINANQSTVDTYPIDMADVRGQHGAKRALEIAAAGGHHILMSGSPGSGKTMLAKRLPTILPPLTTDEALEVTSIHSVAGLLQPDVGLIRQRPFRAPHHTISQAGLVGGGDPVRPGEVSLAHNGCLFLDELLEFRRNVLEVLRQPLEDGHVTICRARARATFPATPILIGAMNPCPCGYAQDPRGRCLCTPERIRSYRSRLSGPLLDRLDIQIPLPPTDFTRLTGTRDGEPSEQIRQRVQLARNRQMERYHNGICSVSTNALLPLHDLEKVCVLDAQALALLSGAISQMALSPRVYGKILRLARTIADLAELDKVTSDHIAEAIGLRLLDRPLS